MHAVARVTEWNLPRAHWVHSSDFVAAAYMPGLQESHMLLPAALAFLPGAQSMQDPALTREYVPLTQFVHAVVDVTSLNLPEGQSVHAQSICFVPRNLPVGQATFCVGHVEHAGAPIAANLP
jgi:hypothetical protein